jgi:hypothetical protein
VFITVYDIVYISLLYDVIAVHQIGQATSKFYHLLLRVECSLFCNLQSRARSHVVLVIGWYALLGNPTH